MLANPSAYSSGGDRLQLPAWWWGDTWADRREFTLSEMIACGFVDSGAAILLRTAIECGKSVTIAGDPSGAGKTALLTSLLPFVPRSCPRFIVRGHHETFAMLTEQSGAKATFWVNEISPHLPIYCWGSSLRRLLKLGEAGHQILSTIHGRSVDEIVESLIANPMALPPKSIASLGIIAFIETRAELESMRRRVNVISELVYDQMSDSIQECVLNPSTTISNACPLGSRRSTLVESVT
jgi:hypothetical protein